MSLRAWVVIAETGEYDENVNWNVGVLFDKTAATKYKEKLVKFLQDNKIPEESWKNCMIDAPQNPDDLRLKELWRNYGVYYRVEEVRVVG